MAQIDCTHAQFHKSASSFYPSQTKILEGATKDEIRIFESLVRGVSTRFGLLTIEKCFENTVRSVCSAFQNLRLGTIKLRHFFVRYMDIDDVSVELTE